MISLYTLCKNVIKSGNYTNREDMTGKLDVLLLGGRITTEQYTELVNMIPAAE